MRPVRGRPSRSNASDELWRNGKATAMVIGGPIVATDAVYAPAVVSAISLCTGPTLWKGGVDVTSCLARVLYGVWPKFELSHLQQRCHMCYRRYE